MSAPSASPVRNVVFDVGNVLIAWDPNHLYSRLIPDAAEREHFLTHVCSPAWNLEQDRGRSWAEAIDELSVQHPEKRELIEAYSSGWHDMVPGTIADTVVLLEDLKAAEVPLYAITNFSAEKWIEATGRFPFLGNSFIDTVVSAHERLLKPDPAIYHVLLERNGLVAEECVFIDDSPRNVEGARAVGMQAIHFTGPANLRAALAELGIRG
ncbi:HAD family hydrolase [Roseibium aestuarii]|uniref:HAD family hydrolase n=1 Tax=Roseibium aestuarii TaxID=2600299 RepID=A0ABW4JUL9_9HYPH|nr:HAD family phosphatase [Roseibium aestuarii]